jgi:hypothetical protein
MYRCDVCARVVPANTPSNLIVVETRVVDHPPREEAHWHPPSRGGKGKWVDDPGGRGTQIARTRRVCHDCVS